MERERLIEFVDGKPPSTISSYLNNYKKVQGAVGRELHLVSLQEMEQVVNGLTNSYASRKCYANIWSICNFKMLGKDTSPEYIEFYKNLSEKIEKQLRDKHKQIKSDIIPMETLINHEDKLFENGEFSKFVACFLVRNCYCRNSDLNITVVDEDEDIDDKNNFMVVYYKRVVIIRQDYKTSKTYGRIETEFNDKRFVTACKQLPFGEKLFPGADTASKLQNRLKKALYTNEVQYLNTKIDEISKTGNLKELKIVSDRRGSGLDQLITAYNLDF